MADRQRKGDGKRPPPRAERLLDLAGKRYELHRTAAFPYLLRGDRRYRFEGQDRRDLGADLRSAWRTAYPGDGVPSRDDIAQVLDDLRLHAELTDPDPATPAEEADELFDGDAVCPPPDYYTEDGCTYWNRPAQGGGIVPVMLSTFVAEITDEVVLDDGAEQSLTWLVRVTARDGRCGEVRITPDQLGRPHQWATKAAGISALVMPGLAIQDHLRVAVQSGSGSAERKTVFTHTGWREIGGSHVYLTASGALGAGGLDDSVTVDLGMLSGYALPGETDETALREAIRASLGLLALAPDKVTVPLLAAVYRAPLPLLPDCAVWLYGRTGTFKTAITSLAQQHFGAAMDAQHLPGNWTSTANALEAQAFQLAGALFTVDDYSPDATKMDAQRRGSAADRLIRGMANQSARGRMRPDGSMRPAKPPRAQVLTSAEDVPPGVESMLARTFVAELTPAGVDLDVLTAAQLVAGEGTLALATAGYVRHLAARYDADPALASALARQRDEYRDKASAEGHPRTALNIASLALGWHEFLAYAREAGAVTAEECAACWTQVWEALRAVGADQDRYRRETDPVRVYLRSLIALVSSGRAHLAALDGGEPENPGAWGWIEDPGRWELAPDPADPDGAPVRSPVWRAQGDRIGWTDGENVYLHPDAAYRAARQFAEGTSNQLTASIQAVHKELHERRLLASKPAKGHHTVRRDVGGQRSKHVLHLTARRLDGSDT